MVPIGCGPKPHTPCNAARVQILDANCLRCEKYGRLQAVLFKSSGESHGPCPSEENS